MSQVFTRHGGSDAENLAHVSCQMTLMCETRGEGDLRDRQALMAFVVVPWSAFPGTVVPSTAALVEGVIVHIVCVGLPIAYITSRWPASG